MKSKNKISVLFIVIAFILTAVSFSHAVKIPESPGTHVVDLAGIVDETTEMRLNTYLNELEQKTSAQIAVLTIKSLEGESLEDLSLSVAHDKWKLGQKGKDNGVLLLVSLKDRKYRFEIGYGLEGIIPDSLAGSIGRDYLVPFFKKGDYSKGIYAAILVIANEIAKDSKVEITGMPKLQRPVQRGIKGQPSGLFGNIIFAVFFIVMLILFIRNPKLFLALFLLSSMGGRSGSWGGGGSSFGGGGFGGFSGGGGGFGGGGASGGW